LIPPSDATSKQYQVLNETISHQRELIGKLVTAIVQDRLKQPGFHFRSPNLQSSTLCSDVEKLLTYTEKIRVDQSLTTSGSEHENRSLLAEKESNAKKRRRTLSNGFKKVVRLK